MSIISGNNILINESLCLLCFKIQTYNVIYIYINIYLSQERISYLVNYCKCHINMILGMIKSINIFIAKILSYNSKFV